MKQFTSNELRNGWLNFYKERGHVDVGAVSLVSDGSTGVMFNVAGMQPAAFGALRRAAAVLPPDAAPRVAAPADEARLDASALRAPAACGADPAPERAARRAAVC